MSHDTTGCALNLNKHVWSSFLSQFVVLCLLSVPHMPLSFAFWGVWVFSKFSGHPGNGDGGLFFPPPIHNPRQSLDLRGWGCPSNMVF